MPNKAKAASGKGKKRKTDQPKRHRYNIERRGQRHKLADLERHVAAHPEDVKAKGDLDRIKRAFTEGKA